MNTTPHPAEKLLAPVPREKRQALLSELEKWIADPNSEASLLNGWLHSPGIPAPSFELMQYLSFRLLTWRGILLFAADASREQIIAKVLEALREETSETRRDSINLVSSRLKCFHFLHAPKKGTQHKHALDWLPILWPFLYPAAEPADPEADRLTTGTRVITRAILESLMLRAVFHWEVGRIEGLAAALRAIRDNDFIAPTAASRTAGEIIRWLPILWDGLKRRPSKAEMIEFLEVVFPDLKPTPNDRSKAFRSIGWPDDKERKTRMDRVKIHSLARKSRLEVLTH